MIGPSFFNRVSIPISLIILGLLGICQLFPWKKIPLSASRWKYMIALGGTLLAALALFVSGMRYFSTLVTCSLGIFVVITTGLSLRKLSWSAAAFHLGTVVICVGIAISSTYKLEKEVELIPGESTTLGNIRLQFVRMNSYEDVQKGRMVAEVAIYKNEERLASVTPEKRFYGNAQVTTEIGLHTSLKNDIYVILEGWDEQHRTTFLFILYPMILWIWIGGFVIFTLGMILAVIKQTKPG
jgi:cytochrome c-type biogenesis protein CcmF